MMKNTIIYVIAVIAATGGLLFGGHTFYPERFRFG